MLLRVNKAMMRSRQIYYGWVIVGVVFLSSLASGAQINPTIGVFLKPITEEFGWTRSMVAGAVALGTFVGGFTAVLAGPIIDRFGARWILWTSFLLAGSALVSLGFASSLLGLYASIFVSRVALQGVINLTNQTIVAKWFIKSRGRAMAIANLGQRIGGGVIPFIAQQMILISSWRIATISLGGLVWALTLIPIGIWLRRKPEDMGLLPDGIRTSDEVNDSGIDSKNKSDVSEERNYTLREALASRPFWVISWAICMTMFVNSGVNFNLVAHITDRGLSESQSATVLLIWALSSVPATLGAGVMAERFAIRLLMIWFSLGLALGILIFLFVSGFMMGLVFAVLHGASFASSFLMLQLLMPDYYGSKSLGTLRGFTLPPQMMANAMGPLTAALVYDLSGSYGLILSIYIAIQGLLIFSLWVALPSRRQWEISQGARIAL